MSFSQTMGPFLAGTKTVTRRKGWRALRPGERVRAVDRVMGFRKGERPKTLGVIEVVDVRRERLDAITDKDVALEGFPGRSAQWFIDTFAHVMGGRPDALVTRIEFRVLELNDPRRPTSLHEWEALRTLTGEQLTEKGLGNWNGRLRVFPAHWYGWIPKGLELEATSGDSIVFQPGETDDDQRLGFLAYGVPAVDGEVVAG